MDRDSLEDLFQPFGRVQVKRMFGGHGVFADGLMFALYGRGRIFLKADEETAERFADEGCEEFVYARGAKTVSLGYWTLPDRALDDPDELIAWSRLAHAAARRKKARAAKRTASRKAAPRGKVGKA